MITTATFGSAFTLSGGQLVYDGLLSAQDDSISAVGIFFDNEGDISSSHYAAVIFVIDPNLGITAFNTLSGNNILQYCGAFVALLTPDIFPCYDIYLTASP